MSVVMAQISLNVESVGKTVTWIGFALLIPGIWVGFNLLFGAFVYAPVILVIPVLVISLGFALRRIFAMAIATWVIWLLVMVWVLTWSPLVPVSSAVWGLYSSSVSLSGLVRGVVRSVVG